MNHSIASILALSAFMPPAQERTWFSKPPKPKLSKKARNKKKAAKLSRRKNRRK